MGAGALHHFTADDVERLDGPAWLRARRLAALEEFAVSPLPSEKEEVWRYSPIDRLDLDRYSPATLDGELGPLAGRFVDDLLADLAGTGPIVVTRNGGVVRTGHPSAASGLSVGRVADRAEEPPGLGAVLSAGDALTGLNDASFPDAVIIEVEAGAVIAEPVVVIHWCDGWDGQTGGPAPASFPRTLVWLGRDAEVSVIEVVAGAPVDQAALVVPVTELVVGEAARLAYASMQVLGTGAWHIGRLGATAGRDASVKVFTAGLGGNYDRMRTDAAVTGPGAASELRSVYLGTGEQIHDVRTQQDHEAPRTTSNLLCKGAVAGTSRSIYSGLIRIRNGAVRSEAMQTNHNLVLDERAHADSVPNLDIEENDVRCSHASTVGPVDEDQRYYLETRGVPAEQAEQLIVQGFFDDIVDQVPVQSLANRLRNEVGLRLAGAIGLVGAGGSDS